jgi:outer membrane protein assembly factor BamD (BamD/ComL family)
MSVSNIFSTSLFDYGTQSRQNTAQQLRKEFDQLGQDLQSGNLTAAQSDFAAMQRLMPQANSTSTTQSTNPLAQDLNQLGQDLQAGNTTAAQQDFSKIQQDFQSQAPAHHHHHHGGGGGSGISQLLSQLGQALQSDNLSSAQQTYNTLLQDFQNMGQSGALPQTSSQSGLNGLSVNA